MSRSLRFLGLAVVLVLEFSLPGCGGGGGGRSTGRTTFAIGSGGSTWSRTVAYAVDGSAGITSQNATATLTFAGGKLVVEKTRLLLDGKELAALQEDAKVVEIDYTAGVLTVTVDGTKVHEGKPR